MLPIWFKRGPAPPPAREPPRGQQDTGTQPPGPHRQGPPSGTGETKVAGPRSASFDTLRLIGTVLVLVGHSFVLTNSAVPRVGGVPIHTLGLSIFFSLSGYLVMGSFLSDPNGARYLVKRSLRIFPGLFVVLLVTAFCIGPLVTEWSLSAYLRDRYTYLFVLQNVVLWYDDWLPGVFEFPPFDGAANGSLWTLSIEFCLYLVVPIFAWAGRASRKVAAALLFALAVAAAFEGHRLKMLGEWKLYHFVLDDALQLAPYFLCGMALRLMGFEPGAPIRVAMWCGALFLAAGLLPAPWNYLVGFAPFAALVAALGRSDLLAAPILERVGDLSYGIYLIAWPIQGALVVAFGGQGGAALNAAMTACLALPWAWFSWRFIESPALAWKTRILAGRRPSLARAR
ncbi:acyltransferase [Phenylobacterium sp.]|uniref:acyltransferase family protein n=1 Tax=Phenylobacterium sp. TaxID=1871053 RepID=UPI00289B36F2|nr:acyltransferase [Phenylobacterium sp.]